jgi:hypothetical protein
VDEGEQGMRGSGRAARELASDSEVHLGLVRLASQSHMFRAHQDALTARTSPRWSTLPVT